MNGADGPFSQPLNARGRLSPPKPCPGPPGARGSCRLPSPAPRCAAARRASPATRAIGAALEPDLVTEDDGRRRWRDRHGVRHPVHDERPRPDPRLGARRYGPAMAFFAVVFAVAWLFPDNRFFAYCLVPFVALAFFYVIPNPDVRDP